MTLGFGDMIGNLAHRYWVMVSYVTQYIHFCPADVRLFLHIGFYDDNCRQSNAADKCRQVLSIWMTKGWEMRRRRMKRPS
jgi:hypothetical protein